MFNKGHMESRSSIRYVLITTSFISLAYSASQGALEILMKDSIFRINKDLNLFGHGGVMFWLISSVIFTMVISKILKINKNISVGVLINLIYSSAIFTHINIATD